MMAASLRQLGGYELIREVGAGAMGEVWLGRDIRLDRPVAIKMMRCEIANDPVYVERFEREAKAVARLSHPNIVQIFSFGEEAGMVYFAMEWVNGNTLACRIRDHGAIGRLEALNTIRQTAEALHYACTMGIIHRDIKPGNIMLDTAGTVKVADFGLAKITDQDSQMTATGAPMGSPNYMAPEACRGESLDHRADIYSLGVTFYQMLQGELPFAAPTPMSVMFKHVSEPLPEPPALQILDNGIWMDVLRKMTAKSPSARYPSYTALLEDLDRLKSASGETGSFHFQPAVTNADLTSGLGHTGAGYIMDATALAPNVPSRKIGRARSIGIAAAVLLAAAGAGAWYLSSRSAATSPLSAGVSNSPVMPAFTPTPAMMAASPGSEEKPPSASDANARSDTSLYLNFVAGISPEASHALSEYDFTAAYRLLSASLQAGRVSAQSRPMLEALLVQVSLLSGFREALAAGATQRPGISQMQTPTLGTLRLVGGTANSLKFQSATGLVDIPYRDIPPAQMVLMGAPYNNPESYKAKADAFIAIWPSVRSALPPPAQRPGGPPGPQGRPPKGRYGGFQEGQDSRERLRGMGAPATPAGPRNESTPEPTGFPGAQVQLKPAR